jgi:hypothetical protein
MVGRSYPRRRRFSRSLVLGQASTQLRPAPRSASKSQRSRTGASKGRAYRDSGQHPPARQSTFGNGRYQRSVSAYPHDKHVQRRNYTHQCTSDDETPASTCPRDQPSRESETESRYKRKDKEIELDRPSPGEPNRRSQRPQSTKDDDGDWNTHNRPRRQGLRDALGACHRLRLELGRTSRSIHRACRCRLARSPG